MPIPDACLFANYPGSGGVAGGAGPEGAVSSQAGGKGVYNGGVPFLSVVTGSNATLTIELKTQVDGGDPVDLSGVDHVQFVAKEMPFTPEYYVNQGATIVDGTGGVVSVTLTPDQLKYAGIWPASLITCSTPATSNTPGEIIEEFSCWLYVKRSLTSLIDDNRPITIPEIRMALRDTSPSYNTLLEDLEFSDEEIVYAMMRPIEEWNEGTPHLEQYTYTPGTFPFRENWRKATIGYLLKTAAYHYQRNYVPYSAAGVSFDDKNKARQYFETGEQALNEWRQFVLSKKRELNMGLCFGVIGSRSFYGGARR